MEPVEFSKEALEAFRRQARKAQTGLRAIRLGVRGGACSGLQYAIEFDYNDVRPGDIEWNPAGWDEYAYDPSQPEGSLNRIRLVYFRVDKKSALYLTGSRVTWSKTLMREGFDFENPNESSRCGCGQSFSTK